MRYKQIIQSKVHDSTKAKGEERKNNIEQEEIEHIYHTFLEHVIILLER